MIVERIFLLSCALTMTETEATAAEGATLSCTAPTGDNGKHGKCGTKNNSSSNRTNDTMKGRNNGHKIVAGVRKPTKHVVREAKTRVPLTPTQSAGMACRATKQFHYDGTGRTTVHSSVARYAIKLLRTEAANSIHSVLTERVQNGETVRG